MKMKKTISIDSEAQHLLNTLSKKFGFMDQSAAINFCIITVFGDPVSIARLRAKEYQQKVMFYNDLAENLEEVTEDNDRPKQKRSVYTKY